MNDPILFDRNDDLGIVRMWSYDSDTDEVTIQTIQDVEGIIEANRAEFNEHTSLDRWGELKRVASIPMSLYAASIVLASCQCTCQQVVFSKPML